VRQRELFQHSFDPVVFVDIENLTILEANPAFYKFTGILPEKIGTTSVLNWIAPGDQEAFIQSLQGLGNHSSATTWEELWKTGDRAAAPVMVTACRVKLNSLNHEAIQLIIRDVTQERGTKPSLERYTEQLNELRRKLELYTTIDETTGVANRRQTDQQLQVEHSRASRYSEVYSILMVGIDFSELYRAVAGAKITEETMRQIAQIVRQSCRITDSAGRFSLTEFLLIFPRTSHLNARVVAERIRQAVEFKPFIGGSSLPGGKLTVSCGIASFPTHGTSSGNVLEKASQAMQKAMEQGKNRSEDAGDAMLDVEPKRAGLFSRLLQRN
jgi:diguanylate cyclase (GGDEF)-like protein/PAS domain S-box-containing protein